jgi:hypothetical protein
MYVHGTNKQQPLKSWYVHALEKQEQALSLWLSKA